MIGKVAGMLDYRGADHVLIETRGGVGYIVYASDRTLAAMPAEGQQVALYTELVVREDLLQLYGFLTLAEREWHRLLTSVQGVGAKAALAIMGTLGAEGTARAISLGDAAAIKAAPGVGPKLAARVVNELKDKAPTIMAMGAGGARAAMVSGGSETSAGLAQPPEAAPQKAASRTPSVAPGGDRAGAQADALSALINLGYPQGEAAQAVAEAGADDSLDASGLIKAALKLLAPKG